MSRPAEIEDMVSAAIKHFGAVDILVNNAGIQHVSPIEAFPVDRWDAIIAINLSAVFHAMRAALPAMRERGWGRIINIASVHGVVGSAGKSAYVAAKHGVIGLTKVGALETADSNITVNAICPGWVLTPLVQQQIDALAARGPERRRRQAPPAGRETTVGPVRHPAADRRAGAIPVLRRGGQYARRRAEDRRRLDRAVKRLTISSLDTENEEIRVWTRFMQAPGRRWQASSGRPDDRRGRFRPLRHSGSADRGAARFGREGPDLREQQRRRGRFRPGPAAEHAAGAQDDRVLRGREQGIRAPVPVGRAGAGIHAAGHAGREAAPAAPASQRSSPARAWAPSWPTAKSASSTASST